MNSVITRKTAEEMIESLRKGVPPRRNVSWYAAGTDFVNSVRKRHLDGGIDSGKIRFVNGSWGSGKTHFFRLLREEAFDANLLVSTVELDAEQTPFNKFERVFYDIVRNITSPRMYEEGNLSAALPFGEVLREAFERKSAELGGDAGAVEALKEELFQQTGIDIDFRRVVGEYWSTFAAESGDPVVLENTRGTLLQWFEGEGQATMFRREFGVQKMVTKENARLVLTSLGQFVRWLGYGGLVILFDESEMTHSTMRRSSLKQAHNNLLHLINEIDESEGLFLLYAAVPEFFTDPKHGITIYGALAARIGAPAQRPPRALDRVWNIDAMATTVEDFQSAASRVREIYVAAYPDGADSVVSDDKLRSHMTAVVAEHPEFANVSAWRVVITATVDLLDHSLEGGELPTPPTHHASIMERLGDD
jgi:hypothetical protein